MRNPPCDDPTCLGCSRWGYTYCVRRCVWCANLKPCPEPDHFDSGDDVMWQGEDWFVSSMHFFVGDKQAASIVRNQDVRDGLDVRRREVVPMDDLVLVKRYPPVGHSQAELALYGIELPGGVN